MAILVNVVPSVLRVANMVGLHLICKPQVDGSNPSVGSILLPHRTGVHGLFGDVLSIRIHLKIHPLMHPL